MLGPGAGRVSRWEPQLDLRRQGRGGSEALWASCKFESRSKVRNPASRTAQSPHGIVWRMPVHTARTSPPGPCSHPAPLCHSSSSLCPPHLPFLPPKLNSTSGPALPKLLLGPALYFCTSSQVLPPLVSWPHSPNGEAGTPETQLGGGRSPGSRCAAPPSSPPGQRGAGARARTTGEPGAVPKTGSLITLCLH